MKLSTVPFVSIEWSRTCMSKIGSVNVAIVKCSSRFAIATEFALSADSWLLCVRLLQHTYISMSYLLCFLSIFATCPKTHSMTNEKCTTPICFKFNAIVPCSGRFVCLREGESVKLSAPCISGFTLAPSLICFPLCHWNKRTKEGRKISKRPPSSLRLPLDSLVKSELFRFWLVSLLLDWLPSQRPLFSAPSTEWSKAPIPTLYSKSHWLRQAGNPLSTTNKVC